jgi:hypothetical protein
MITVANQSPSAGTFTYVWLYASADTATPVAAQIGSNGIVSLQPPPANSAGDTVRTLVLYNTSKVQLYCSINPPLPPQPAFQPA